ncbi:MAG: hypothetical protein EXR21_04170 [Flavobacteriaceae bacterium]|nr:hypothetical protein [Flavobacteriaceae bacterium]
MKSKALFTVLVLTSFSLQSQHYFGFYLNGSRPLGSLHDSGWRKGLGFSFEYLSKPLLSKEEDDEDREGFDLRIGSGLDFQWHGSRRFDSLPFKTTNNDTGYTKFGHNTFGLFVGPKLVYKVNDWEPYLELNLAIRNFNTSQVNTFYKEVAAYERSTSTNVNHYWIPHIGLGLGVMKQLGKRAIFDMRVCYSMGGRIKMTSLPDIKLGQNGQDAFIQKYVHPSASNMLFFRVGFMFKLDKSDRDDDSPIYTEPQPDYSNPKPNTTQPIPKSEPRNPRPTTEKKKPAEVKPAPKPKPQN